MENLQLPILTNTFEQYYYDLSKHAAYRVKSLMLSKLIPRQSPPYKALKIFCRPSQRHSVGVFSSKRLVTTCQSVTSLVNPLQPLCT